MTKSLLFLLSFISSIALNVSAIEIKSADFTNDGLIPIQYTCDGENISPPLEWSGFPKNTKSFALIVDDPDAPSGVITHWVIYNIPADVASLAENIQDYPQGALGGQNYKGEMTYTGPCPPDKMHRYFFKIYALKNSLPLPEGATKEQVLEAMEGHILEKAELVGLYDRQKKTKNAEETKEQVDRHSSRKEN